MAEPFNKAARERALEIWENDGDVLRHLHRVEDILRNGDMSRHDEVRALIFDLQILADELADATTTLGEEDE